MKLNVKAFATACAILWALGVFTVAVCNLVWPSYGGAFLAVVAAIYPGYKATNPGFGQVIVGTLYALVDGWIGAALLAVVYNRLADRGGAAKAAGAK